MSNIKYVFFALALFVVAFLVTRKNMPVERQPPWTEQEINCAAMMTFTESGGQYTEPERLRMCRVFIEKNGGFE